MVEQRAAQAWFRANTRWQRAQLHMLEYAAEMATDNVLGSRNRWLFCFGPPWSRLLVAIPSSSATRRAYTGPLMPVIWAGSMARTKSGCS